MPRSQATYTITFIVTLVLAVLGWYVLIFVLGEEDMDTPPGSAGAVLFWFAVFAAPGAHFTAWFVSRPASRRRALYVTRLPGEGIAVLVVALVVLFLVPSILASAITGSFGTGQVATADEDESDRTEATGASETQPEADADGQPDDGMGDLPDNWHLTKGILAVGLLCGGAWALRLCGLRPWRYMGFLTGRFWRHVGLGLAAYLAFRWALLPVISALIDLVFPLLGFPVEPHEAFNEYEQARSVTARVGILVAILIDAPLIEEVMFRSALFQLIKRFAPSWVAILISALIFAALHGPVTVCANIFFLGVLFGYLFDKTGSIVPGIVLHFFFNLTSAIAMVLMA